MCASSTDRRHAGRCARGFTLAELVAVLVVLGVLAVAVMPRMDAALAMRNTGWHDQVLAALRQARSLAQGHRRLVCVTVATGSVTLAIASAHPASACTTALPGPDGGAAFAQDGSGIATTLTPAGTLYFQPSGRITSDGAGTAAVDASIGIDGEPDITTVGETGHVH